MAAPQLSSSWQQPGWCSGQRVGSDTPAVGSSLWKSQLLTRDTVPPSRLSWSLILSFLQPVDSSQSTAVFSDPNVCPASSLQVFLPPGREETPPSVHIHQQPSLWELQVSSGRAVPCAPVGSPHPAHSLVWNTGSTHTYFVLNKAR